MDALPFLLPPKQYSELVWHLRAQEPAATAGCTVRTPSPQAGSPRSLQGSEAAGGVSADAVAGNSAAAGPDALQARLRALAHAHDDAGEGCLSMQGGPCVPALPILIWSRSAFRTMVMLEDVDLA